MKCAEAQKRIRPFLKRELPPEELDDFLQHIENCPDCYEELELYLMIQAALEEDETKDFGFQERVRNEIRLAHQRVTVYKIREAFRKILIAVPIILFIVAALNAFEVDLISAFRGNKAVPETQPDPKTAIETVSEAETEAEAVSETAAESVSEAAAEAVSEAAVESVSETAAASVSEGVIETETETEPE